MMTKTTVILWASFLSCMAAVASITVVAAAVQVEYKPAGWVRGLFVILVLQGAIGLWPIKPAPEGAKCRVDFVKLDHRMLLLVDGIVLFLIGWIRVLGKEQGSVVIEAAVQYLLMAFVVCNVLCLLRVASSVCFGGK